MLLDIPNGNIHDWKRLYIWYLSMSNEIFHIEYELVLVNATKHNRDKEETFTSILHEFYKAVMGDDNPLATLIAYMTQE